MTSVLKYIFYPFIITVSMLGAILLMEVIDDNYVLLIPTIILIPLLTIIIFFEMKMPYNKKWNKNNGDLLTDIIQTFITLPIATQIAQLLLPFIIILPFKSLFNDFVMITLESELSMIWSFVVLLLMSEFLYYWMHRLSHSITPMWKLHSVHHIAERLYWANSGRFHFIDALFGGIAYFLPLVLFNASIELTMLLLLFSGVTGFLEHVNIDFRGGVLNYIFNTAELHRWHHSINEKESNNNYGKALIIWDIIFKTYYLPVNKKINTVGVENLKDVNNVVNQFLLPFKK